MLTITIRPQKLARILVWGVVVLSLLNFGLLLIRTYTGHSRLLGLGRMFNMGFEANIPTCYSSFILLLSSVLLWTISSAEKARKARHAGWWKMLSFIFLYMSIDEAASIHETIADALAHVSGSTTLAGYGGVIPDALLVAAVAIVSLPLIRSLDNAIRRLFITAGVLYVGGAAGIEALERVWDMERGAGGFLYGLMIAVEETMEMAGVVLFIYALASYLALHIPSVELRFGSPALSEPAAGKNEAKIL